MTSTRPPSPPKAPPRAGWYKRFFAWVISKENERFTAPLPIVSLMIVGTAWG